MAAQFALFDTVIGRCGIAWGPRGLVGVQLPEARDTATRARVLQRAAGVSPRRFRQAAKGDRKVRQDRLAGLPLG